MKSSLPKSFIFKNQLLHLLLLIPIFFGTVYLADLNSSTGSLLGIQTVTWFYLTIVNVIVHQFIVWFVFRFQLVYKLFSRLFGKYDLIIWGFIFFPFLILRPVLTLMTGISDFQSLYEISMISATIGVLLLIPAFYTLFSVYKYFGLKRALGGDHFLDKYRNMPLVREGMFKYSSDAMYLFAFLLFWAIGIFTGSRVALSLALFQHSYIWVHMYCTEEPDMREIYG